MIIIYWLLLNTIGYSSVANNNHNIINLLPLSTNFPNANAQEIVTKSTTNSSLSKTNSATNVDSTERQNYSTIVKADGHFANNQIQDNVVTWIQGGIWSLDIKGNEN